MDVSKLKDYGVSSSVVDVLLKRGIRELNPIQERAVKKGLFSGRNLVLSTPTASGKTLVGELGLVWNAHHGKLGVYLVPLKALANEKYSDFQVWESLGLRVGITTGDYESPGEYLGRYDIVIATYERFDSLLRLKPWWLKRLGVVVVDELHMIGDSERGPVLEMVIARLRNMGVQLIGLSATIGNAGDLANWLDAELVVSDWRPVKLVEGAYDYKRNRIVFVDGRVENIHYRLGKRVLNVVLHSLVKGYQVLVFIHNRRRTEEYAYELVDHMNLLAHMIPFDKAREYARRLESEGPSKMEAERLGRLLVKGVAYHHAGLSSVARRVVEEAFRERVVRAVFATPTLAAGVNLPARRVIVSIKRYDPRFKRTRDIPVFEYKQMAGRAGRPGYDVFGEAIVIDVKSPDEAYRKYIYGRLEPVESKLGSQRSLRIHTLALIAGGDVSSFNGLVCVYKNTLFYHQYRSVRYLESLLNSIIEDLFKWGMIVSSSEPYSATRLGRIVSITYLDPLSAHYFLENIGSRDYGVIYLLHLIAYTPDYRRSRPYIPYKIIDEFEDKALNYADKGLIPGPPLDEVDYGFWLQAFVNAQLLHDWINEVGEDTITNKYGIGPGDLYSVRETASWISASLSRVCYVYGLGELSNKLHKLSTRLEYGVREDALELIRLEGIGRIRARTLLKAGIRSLEELLKTSDLILLSLPGFGPKLVKSIKEQARELLKQ